ncbi:DUF1838 family protein [uncultured Croceitalea sp.]|uniref:DUF1838 family protein n=1 Tax=uncultured Croceitalea sp. TaxID=1798908 RepID=UPI003305FF3B
MKKKNTTFSVIAIVGGLLFLAGCNSKDQASSEETSSMEEVQFKEIAYDLSDPKDKLLIFEKIRGDLSGKLTFSYSEGRVFGIRTDKSDSLNVFGKEVFRYSGCGMKIMRLLDNGNVETKSKGWLLYRDPKTGEFLSEMTNPYTGEVVKVPPFRAGIRGGIMTPEGPEINANFTMESTAIGAPLDLVFTQIGDKMHITRHAFTKWFEKKSQTWRTEMTLDTYDLDMKYLYDRSYTHIPADYHWTSQTSWLSLLKMTGTPGHMIWTSSGSTFFNKEDLPADFIAATEAKQPDVFSEPLTWDEE